MNLYEGCRFVSDGTWFDEGTEVYPCYQIVEGMDSAVFKGVVDGQPDEELCAFYEFFIYDKNGVILSEPNKENL